MLQTQRLSSLPLYLIIGLTLTELLSVTINHGLLLLALLVTHKLQTLWNKQTFHIDLI